MLEADGIKLGSPGTPVKTVIVLLMLMTFSLFTGCDFFDDFLEYEAGANLTFTGENNTDGAVYINSVVVKISGTGDSWKEESYFSVTGKAYTTFSGLEEGEYSVSVNVYDDSSSLASQGTTVFLPSGESLEVEYSIEYIDDSVLIIFQGVSGVSDEDSPDVEFYNSGTGLIAERKSWNGSVDFIESVYTAYGDFSKAGKVSVSYPDGSILGMDLSRSAFDSSIYIENGQFLMARRRGYGETGNYELKRLFQK